MAVLVCRRRTANEGRRNSWATMLLRQSRLCFRPAGVEISSGAKTDHGEPIRPRATLAVSPWLFLRRSRLPIRKTSELPNAAPLWASLLRSVLGGVFVVQTERRPSAATKSGDDAVSRESGPFALRRSRPCRVGETNIEEDTARTGHFGSNRLAFPHADLPAPAAKKGRSRTSYQESTPLRSRHGHFRGNRLARPKNPGDAPIWQCRQR